MKRSLTNLPPSFIEVIEENKIRQTGENNYKDFHNFVALTTFLKKDNKKSLQELKDNFFKKYSHIHTIEDFKTLSQTDRNEIIATTNTLINEINNLILFFKKSVFDFENEKAQTDLIQRYRFSDSLLKSLIEKFHAEKQPIFQKSLQSFNQTILKELNITNPIENKFEIWDFLQNIFPAQQNFTKTITFLQNLIHPLTHEATINMFIKENPTISNEQIALIKNLIKTIIFWLEKANVDFKNPDKLMIFLTQNIGSITFDDKNNFSKVCKFQRDIVNYFLALVETQLGNQTFSMVPAGFKSWWRGDIVEKRTLLEIIVFLQAQSPNDKLTYPGLKTSSNGELILDPLLKLPIFETNRPTDKKNIITENEEFVVFSQITIDELIKNGFLKREEVYNEIKLTDENKDLIEAANKEKPDFIVYHKHSHQLVIGMVQTDLFNGGSKTNRADKYTSLTKNLWKLKNQGITNISFTSIVNDELEIKTNNLGKKASQLLGPTQKVNTHISDLKYFFIDQLDFVLSKCFKKTKFITNQFYQLGESSICYKKWLRHSEATLDNLNNEHFIFNKQIHLQLQTLQQIEPELFPTEDVEKFIGPITNKIGNLFDVFFQAVEEAVLLYFNNKMNNQEAHTLIVNALKIFFQENFDYSDLDDNQTLILEKYLKNVSLPFKYSNDEHTLLENFVTKQGDVFFKFFDRNSYINQKFQTLSPQQQDIDIDNFYHKELLKSICNIDAQTEIENFLLKHLDNNHPQTKLEPVILTDTEMNQGFNSGFKIMFGFTTENELKDIIADANSFLNSFGKVQNINSILHNSPETLQNQFLKIDIENNNVSMTFLGSAKNTSLNSENLLSSNIIPINISEHPSVTPSIERLTESLEIYKKSFKRK